MKLLNYEDCQLAEAMVLWLFYPDAMKEQTSLLGDKLNLFDSLISKCG